MWWNPHPPAPSVHHEREMQLLTRLGSHLRDVGDRKLVGGVNREVLVHQMRRRPCAIVPLRRAAPEASARHALDA